MARSMEIGEKIRKSREMGATDEQIIEHASASDPSFAEKYSKSIQSGAKPNEVLDFLSQQKPQAPQSPEEPGLMQQVGNIIHQAARVPFQYALGVGEGTIGGMIYDPAVAATNKFQESLEDEDMKELNAQRKELPQIKDIYKAGGKLVGIETEPQTKIERAARLAGNLKEFTKKLVGMGVEKGSALWNTIKGAASSAPAAATSIALEDEYGISPVATLMTLGMTVPGGKQLIKTGARETANLVNKHAMFNVRNVSLNPKKILSTFKDEWNNARREALQKLTDGTFTPEQYQKVKPFLEKADEYGIPINLGALTSSKTLKDVERIARKRGLEGEELNTFIQRSAEGWANSAVTLSNKLSRTQRFSQPAEVADSLLTNITRKKQEDLTKEYTDLYGKSSQEFKGTRNLTAEELQPIEDALNGVLTKTTGSLTPTSAEESTSALARQFQDRLTVSPEQAGRGELQGVKLPTGKEGVASAKKQGQEALQERVTAFNKASKKASTAQAKVDKLKRPSSKKKAQEKIKPELEKAQEELEAAQKELEVARERVNKAEGVQEKRLIKSQEDFDAIFSEESKGMRFDKETGKIKFLRDANAATLVQTIQSLNKTIDWIHPETRNLMKGVLDQTKTVLGRVYGKSNPVAYKNYLDANKKFQEFANTFGDNADFKKWGIKSNATPEELLGTINTLSRFKKFENTFGGTTQGRELIDELKRLKVQEKLLPVFENWKPGQVNRGLTKLFRDHEFQYMLSKEVRSDLKTLQGLDRRIESVNPQFYAKGQHSEQKKSLLEMIKFGNPKTAAAMLGIKIASQRMADAYASILFDPNMTKEMIRIGEQSLKAVNNPKTTSKVLDRLAADAELLWSNIKQTESIIASQKFAGHLDEDER